MDAEATIIDRQRARNRERVARIRAKQKEGKCAEKVAKRAAKRMIREREANRMRKANYRAKKKEAKNHEVETTTTPPPMTATTMEAAVRVATNGTKTTKVKRAEEGDARGSSRRRGPPESTF